MSSHVLDIPRNMQMCIKPTPDKSLYMSRCIGFLLKIFKTRLDIFKISLNIYRPCWAIIFMIQTHIDTSNKFHAFWIYFRDVKTKIHVPDVLKSFPTCLMSIQCGKGMKLICFQHVQHVKHQANAYMFQMCQASSRHNADRFKAS